MFSLAPANAYVSRPTTINSPLLSLSRCLSLLSCGQASGECCMQRMACWDIANVCIRLPFVLVKNMKYKKKTIPWIRVRAHPGRTDHYTRSTTLDSMWASWFRCIKCLYRDELRAPLHEEGELQPYVCVCGDRWMRESHCHFQDTWAANHGHRIPRSLKNVNKRKNTRGLTTVGCYKSSQPFKTYGKGLCKWKASARTDLMWFGRPLEISH